jgi:hypothetical protein
VSDWPGRVQPELFRQAIQVSRGDGTVN